MEEKGKIQDVRLLCRGLGGWQLEKQEPWLEPRGEKDFKAKALSIFDEHVLRTVTVVNHDESTSFDVGDGASQRHGGHHTSLE